MNVSFEQLAPPSLRPNNTVEPPIGSVIRIASISPLASSNGSDSVNAMIAVFASWASNGSDSVREALSAFVILSSSVSDSVKEN